jgi:hypothetical protein
MAVVLGADTPLTARTVAERARLHYSHCKAVVRGLVAWGLLERTSEGLRFQPDHARWGPPKEAVPKPQGRSNQTRASTPAPPEPTATDGRL